MRNPRGRQRVKYTYVDYLLLENTYKGQYPIEGIQYWMRQDPHSIDLDRGERTWVRLLPDKAHLEAIIFLTTTTCKQLLSWETYTVGRSPYIQVSGLSRNIIQDQIWWAWEYHENRVKKDRQIIGTDVAYLPWGLYELYCYELQLQHRKDVDQIIRTLGNELQEA